MDSRFFKTANVEPTIILEPLFIRTRGSLDGIQGHLFRPFRGQIWEIIDKTKPTRIPKDANVVLYYIRDDQIRSDSFIVSRDPDISLINREDDEIEFAGRKRIRVSSGFFVKDEISDNNDDSSSSSVIDSNDESD